MSDVTDACDRILACLQKTDLWDAQRFQPGLSYEEIDEKSKELSFPLTPELYELFQWRNGNPWSNKFVLDGYWMLSLEDALNAYCLRSNFADIRDLYFDYCGNYGSEDDNYFWNRHWFPIFHNEDSYRFWVVKIGQDSSPVLDLIPGEFCAEIYPSLTKMLKAEAECFEKVIELYDGRDFDREDIQFPNPMTLTNVRRKCGYKFDY